MTDATNQINLENAEKALALAYQIASDEHDDHDERTMKAAEGTATSSFTQSPGCLLALRIAREAVDVITAQIGFDKAAEACGRR